MHAYTIHFCWGRRTTISHTSTTERGGTFVRWGHTQHTPAHLYCRFIYRHTYIYIHTYIHIMYIEIQPNQPHEHNGAWWYFCPVRFCIHVHIYICVYIRIHVYVYIHTRIYTYIVYGEWSQSATRAQRSVVVLLSFEVISIYTHYTHMHIYIYIHIYTHMYIYIYIYIYIYKPTPLLYS